MDPNATLERIRALSAAILTESDAPTPSHIAVEAMGVELAEACQALDDWMRRGGFSPWPGELPD